MSVTQPPGGGGSVPGRGRDQKNVQQAMLKLNSLMFQSMMKFGSAGLQGITAGQAGDQAGAQRASQEMMLAKTEMTQVKQAVESMQAPPEQPLAGGQTGAQPVHQPVDGLTGQSFRNSPPDSTL